MLQAIGFVVSVVFLLLIAGLATIAFRGGERAGYHEMFAAPAGETTMAQRRTRISPVNQVLVWGLALTLIAATVAMLVASFILDSWTWA